MDETEYEDGETEDGALPTAAPFETREQYMAAYGQALQGQERAAQQAAAARQQAYERAQRYIEQNSFGRPTQSEQLLRLSQALLSPRRSRSFGATLANVVPALAENQQLARQADEQRAAALQQLQQQYTTGEAEAALTAANARRAGLEPLARLYNQPAGRALQYQLDPNSGRQQLVPGTGGLPPKREDGVWVVSTPDELAVLQRLVPGALVVSSEAPNAAPRRLGGGQ